MSAPQKELYAHLGAIVTETLATAIALGWDRECRNGTFVDPAIQKCAAFYGLMYHNVYKNVQADQVLVFSAMKKIQLVHPVTIDYIVAELAKLTIMVAVKLDLGDLQGRNIPAPKLYAVLSADIDDILTRIGPKVVPTLVGTQSPEVYDPDAGVTVTAGTL